MYFVQPDIPFYELNVVKSDDTVKIHRIMLRLDKDLKQILNNKNELQDIILKPANNKTEETTGS